VAVFISIVEQDPQEYAANTPMVRNEMRAADSLLCYRRRAASRSASDLANSASMRRSRSSAARA
jgi:hypothetical protein